MPVRDSDRFQLTGSGSALFDLRDGVHLDSFRPRSDREDRFPTLDLEKKLRRPFWPLPARGAAGGQIPPPLPANGRWHLA
jgi:hypothetical protein